MIYCPTCDAPLSAWETAKAGALGVPACWCAGLPARVPPTLPNLSFAELCNVDLQKPVRTHDVVRFVGGKYAGDASASIGVALSQDRRMCWGGRGLYGLARHGLIPGARSLADAACAVLIAAPRPLHLEEADFVLEQLGYRFNSDSLKNHLRGYIRNGWKFRFAMDGLSRVSVVATRDARRDFNAKVRVCPTNAGFERWLDEELRPAVEQAIDKRSQRLEVVRGPGLLVQGDRIEFGT
jgi:hypothetical protein